MKSTTNTALKKEVRQNRDEDSNADKGLADYFLSILFFRFKRLQAFRRFR